MPTSTKDPAGTVGNPKASPLPQMASPVRVLSNRDWLDGRTVNGRPIEGKVFPPPTASTWQQLKALMLWRYDAVVVDCESRWLVRVCLAKKFLLGNQCRVLCVDPVLTRPRGFAASVKHVARRWLLQGVDRFVLYFKQTQELQKVFGITSDRIQYVPFKPNTLNALQALQTSDEGYFLACGRSNRDFRTLFAAFRDLPYECRVLAPWNELERHGTHVEGVPCPDNVSLVTDDGSPESWNGWIARARAVVLPIEPGMLSPSGIGTYLVAMALGKCVIITESPATWQILDGKDAVLVPPRDILALRAAVTRVAEDATLREDTADRGRAYALSLGGEERLRNDVLHELSRLLS